MSDSVEKECGDSLFERVHPDGFPVSATPKADAYFEDRGYDTSRAVGELRGYEIRAREAETKLAEAQRTIAWLRSEEEQDFGEEYFDENNGYLVKLDRVREFVSSSPPESWDPPEEAD